jgi:hypothetical protein
MEIEARGITYNKKKKRKKEKHDEFDKGLMVLVDIDTRI